MRLIVETALSTPVTFPECSQMEMTESPQKFHRLWKEINVNSFKLYFYFLPQISIFDKQASAVDTFHWSTRSSSILNRMVEEFIKIEHGIQNIKVIRPITGETSAMTELEMTT